MFQDSYASSLAAVAHFVSEYSGCGTSHFVVLCSKTMFTVLLQSVSSREGQMIRWNSPSCLHFWYRCSCCVSASKLACCMPLRFVPAHNLYFICACPQLYLAYFYAVALPSVLLLFALQPWFLRTRASKPPHLCAPYRTVRLTAPRGGKVAPSRSSSSLSPLFTSSTSFQYSLTLTFQPDNSTSSSFRIFNRMSCNCLVPQVEL